MTVGIFHSLIIVLSIWQGRKQASYCRASDIAPSQARASPVFPIRETILD